MSDRARRAGGYGRAAADPLLERARLAVGRARQALGDRDDRGRRARRASRAIDLTLIADEGPELIDGLLGGEARPGRLARIAGRGRREARARRRGAAPRAVGGGRRGRAQSAARTPAPPAGCSTPARASPPRARSCSRPSSTRGAGARAGAAEPSVPSAPAGAGAAAQPVVIVDERYGARSRAHGVVPRGPRSGAGAGRPAGAPCRGSAPGRRRCPATRCPRTRWRRSRPSIAARDARQGPAAWIGSIGAQLEAFRAGRASVLRAADRDARARRGAGRAGRDAGARRSVSGSGAG